MRTTVLMAIVKMVIMEAKFGSKNEDNDDDGLGTLNPKIAGDDEQRSGEMPKIARKFGGAGTR